MNRFSLLLLVISGLAATATAADNDWTNLSRELKSGDKIDVVRTDKRTVNAEFRSSTDSALIVRIDGTAEQSIAKAEVVRVSLREHAHRVRNGILLGVVGGLVGAGITRFGVACAETNDGCRNAAMAPIGGAAAGAVIGALIPGGSKTIYRVAKL